MAIKKLFLIRRYIFMWEEKAKIEVMEQEDLMEAEQAFKMEMEEAVAVLQMSEWEDKH